MTKPSITVEGGRDLRAALRKVADGTTDLKSAHADAANIVAVAARSIAPRRSGRLAASVRSSGQARQGVIRAGKAAVPYAGVIHFGWPGHNIRPQPFLYDALDRRASEVIDRYEAAVDQIIHRHGLDRK